jgi:hypothetical protein
MIFCNLTALVAGGDLFSEIKRRKAAGLFFAENEVMDCFVQVYPI